MGGLIGVDVPRGNGEEGRAWAAWSASTRAGGTRGRVAHGPS